MSNLTQPKVAAKPTLVKFPRPCTLCESRNNVSQQFGLWVCSSCLSNIEQTSPDLFHMDSNKKAFLNF